MKRIKYLALAALVGVWACSSDNTSAPEITGTISGTVSIEGTGASGITVTLSSGASMTTDGSGAYSFTGVPGGAYTVTISDFPSDVTFSSTSKAAAIQTAGQSVPVDFSGSYIRTASIIGTVTAGGTGIAGVSVAAAGPGGTDNKVSDANGNFAFTALRAGSYTVTISNIPATYNFTTTSQTITVAAGATEQATFSGTKAQDEVTASVVIAGLTNNAGGVVNPAAVAGQLNVKLQIDPGSNQLSKVCVLLDDVEVPNGCQTLSSAVAGANDGPQAATVLEPVFSILTGALDNGSPMWLNGNHTLSARLDLTNATQANVTTSQTLTFANADVVMIEVSPAVGPTIGGDGLAWNGGDVDLTGTAAMYSGGTVASMTLCLKQNSATGNPGVGVTACKTATSSPGTVTIPKTSTSGANLTGWSSQNVIATATTTTSAGSNGPTGTSSSIRLDEVAPTFAVTLPSTVVEQWLGSNFSFSSTASAGPSTSKTVTSLADPGASGEYSGSPMVEFYAATATDAGTDTDAHNAAVVASNSPITDVTTLANSLSNAEYVLVVRAMDAVGNEFIDRMTAPVGFGVDLVAPTFTVGTGSTPDMAINPTGGVSLSITDDYSGFGPTPVQIQIVKRTIVSGSTKTECVAATNTTIGDGDDVASAVPSSGNCAYNAQGSTSFGFSGAPTFNAYYYVMWRLSDKAGNLSTTEGRTALLDYVDPTVTVTGFSIASGTVSGTADLTDNLDIGSWDTRLFFSSSVSLPFTAPTTVSAFDQPLDGSASASGSSSIINSVQAGVGGSIFNMTGVGFGVFDVAGNYDEDFYAAPQTAGTITATVTDFTVSNGDICLSGAGSTACTSPTVPESITLDAIATTGDTDPNPFTEGVYFFVQSNAGVMYQLGHTTSSSFTTGTSTRDWKWSMTLAASQLPPDIVAGGTVNVYAVAVEADMDALSTDNVVNVH